jgi:hypothetical protein
MQLARRIFLILVFPSAAFAQTTFSCPANQYVATQLVNTGQGCAALPAFVTNVSGTTSGGFVVSTTSPASTPVVSVALDGTHYLPTATDQTNWNGKQTAGSYIAGLTGDVTAAGPGSVAASVVKINGGSLPTSAAVVGTNSSGQVVGVPSQAANTVYAAPGGAAGVPTFRALVAADIPIHPSTLVSGLAASATTDTTNATNITSGSLPVARLPIATTAAFGVLKPDGTTITVSGGVISASGGGGGLGYTLQFRGSASSTLSASTTYYSGNAMVTSSTSTSLYVTAPRSGTLKFAEFYGTAGSTPTVTAQIKDLTTNTVLGSGSWSPASGTSAPLTLSGLTGLVTAGDQLQMIIIMGATPATAAFANIAAQAYIE